MFSTILFEKFDRYILRRMKKRISKKENKEEEK
jgi:hypothetical protein